MQRRCGAARFERALETLPSVVREEYDQATALGWTQQATVREATRAVALELDVDPIELAAQVVEESVAQSLRGVWSILVRNTSDEALVSRAATIFGKSFDAGKFRAEALTAGRVRVVIEGWPRAHDMDIASIARGIVAILEVAGRRRRPGRVTALREGARILFDVDAT